MKTRLIFFISILFLWFGTVTAETSHLNIDENNVDLFLPTADFVDEFYRLRRSYQPFGDASTLDFETAVLQASTGSVRVTQLKIDGINHWVDLIIKVKSGVIVLEISDWGTGSPPIKFPRWNDEFPELELDFNLSSADIFGPPARIRLFNVGINSRLYDIDFVFGTNGFFTLSNLYEKGFILYALTPDEEQAFIVASQSDELFTYSDPDYIDFSETVFLSPLALPWEGEDGEQSILINYASGSKLQTMMATDGILLGAYTPPMNSAVIEAFTKIQRSITTNGTLNTELNLCIDKKTELIVDFKADNKLSEQLVSMVFTLAGNSAFKLSNSTLDKIRGTIADSKDAVLEMMANGKVDSTTLGIFVSSTLLKNLTPDEHQHIIKQVWDNNIPNHVQTAANTSGAAAETNYKLAAQALAEGIASTAFPAYTAAVKTVQESVKYAKDTLSDESFHELYKIYKASNGRWEDVVNASVLSTNKFADQKVRAILKAKKEPFDDKAVEAYLEEKMKSLYANESLMAKEREKLNRVKEEFMSLSIAQKNILRARMNGTPTHCDLFQKYLDYVSRTELDLKNSLRNCSDVELKPTLENIKDKAFQMTIYKLRGGGTSQERRAAYQKAKLQWLGTASCLNYEKTASQTNLPAISENGVWVLDKVIQVDRVSTYTHPCYSVSGSMSLESWEFSRSGCDNGTHFGSGTYTTPPETLIPGETIKLTTSVEEGNSVGYHITMGADLYYPATDLSFNKLGDANMSPKWSTTIASAWWTTDEVVTSETGDLTIQDNDAGYYYDPDKYNEDGAFLIYAHAGTGNSTTSITYLFLYKWNE